MGRFPKKCKNTIVIPAQNDESAILKCDKEFGHTDSHMVCETHGREYCVNWENIN